MTEVIDLGDTVVAVAQTLARGHGMGAEMEQTIGYYNWVLDGEAGWSVMLHSVPQDQDSEGIVYAYGPGNGGRSSAVGRITGSTN